MDKNTFKRYFQIGEFLEVETNKIVAAGVLVEISDDYIVIEEQPSNPVIVSILNIVSCKKQLKEDSTTDRDNGQEKEKSREGLISECVSALDAIFEQCSIDKTDFVETNATVTAINNSTVEAITDEGNIVSCAKAAMVGYSRENAAVGNRIFCCAGKGSVSFTSITSMDLEELYNRFIKALNTTPSPRAAIIGSILFYLNKKYGKSVDAYKKEIRRNLKKLSSILETSGESSSNKKINYEDLTDEQLKQALDTLTSERTRLSTMEGRELVKTVELILKDKLGVSVKKKAAKTIIGQLHLNAPSDDFDSNEYIPATCEVVKYYPKFKNGSALDDQSNEIRFKEEAVLDSDLKASLNTCWGTPIPVVCKYKAGKHNIAVFLTKPGTLGEFKARIVKFKSEGNNIGADMLQEFLEDLGYVDSQINLLDLKMGSKELLYETRRQRLIKNFEEAERGFLELISRNYEFDAVVRDLAMMYQEWDSPQRAISFIEHHLPNLLEKIKTYNLLSLLYQAIGKRDKAIEVMEKALALIPDVRKSDKTKREKLKIRIDTLRVKGGNDSSEKKEENELFSNGSIKSALLRYDVSHGSNELLVYVKDKTAEEKLSFVNQKIGELQNTPELPSYYLAKLQLLEDSGEDPSSPQIKSLLADYCKSKARNFFNAGNVASAREYLLQGMEIYEREDLYNLLFLSLCTDAETVLKHYQSPLTYEETVSRFKIIESDDVFYVLIKIVRIRSKLSRRLIKILYNEPELRNWISDEMEIENPSETDFIKHLYKIEKRDSEQLAIYQSQINGLLTRADITELCKQFLQLSGLGQKQIPTVDCHNITSLHDIANLALDLGKKTGFEDFEDTRRVTVSKLETVETSMQKCPTELSTVVLMPLALKLKDLLEREFKRMHAETKPSLSIQITDARYANGKLTLHISISNAVGCSRADNCYIEINSINGVEVSHGSLQYRFDISLRGGEKLSTTLNYPIKIENESLSLKYEFTYTDIDNEVHTSASIIKTNIDSGEDFEDFPNPYIAHVKSNAVKDKSMFKGRDGLIDTISKYVLEDYKGYVLYGQKRSGKSSVLYHITQKLREERIAFAVEYTMGNNIVHNSQTEEESLGNLFYFIVSEIGRAIKEVNREVYRECIKKIVRRSEFEKYPDQTFREYVEYYMDIIVEKLGYKQNKIVLIVDEFTYLYYHIVERKISRNIMEFWKGLVESRVFSFVFAGQDAMPRFMNEFENVFASMHPQELTYIDETSARSLIEEPTWNSKTNSSRFHPDAVSEILKLSACSPFYIMILCNELVEYAKERKKMKIYANDVDDVVQRMICSESSISRKDFDNLISCGESRIDPISKEESVKVLKDIAIKTRHVEYCDTSEIKVFDKETVKNIVDDLLRRKVLEPRAGVGNKVKIKVGLFKHWLLNHE